MLKLSALLAALTLATACLSSPDDGDVESGDVDQEEDPYTPDQAATSLSGPLQLPTPVGFDVTTTGGVPTWVHFANPVAAGGRDLNLIAEIVRLIESTEDGGHIRAAIHSLGIPKVANALIAAKRDHNITVEVVEDGKDEFPSLQGSEAGRTLHAELKALGATHVWCGDRTKDGNHGCITTNPSGIMHTKLFTFSKTKDPTGQLRSNVVWFGSANMTFKTGAETFNNTVTIYGDSALFDSFNHYFNQLRDQDHFAGNDFYNADKGRGYFFTPNARVYASPEANSDLIENRLDDVIPDSTCEVRVAQAMIFESRANLVSQLIRLKKGKCKVYVVGNTIQPGQRKRLRANSVDIPVHRQKGALHDKYILVDARFAGSTDHRKIVFTGSHNWTSSANSRNDELFIRLEGQKIYDKFHDHFHAAFSTGEVLPNE